MINLILIGCTIIAIIVLTIWLLSMITIPLFKAGVSLVFIIFIIGVVIVVIFAFMSMGFDAFAVLGLLALAVILKLLSF